MVSLSRSFNTTGGGVFFNDASLSIEDDAQQLEPIIGTAEVRKFQTLSTVFVSIFQLLFAWFKNIIMDYSPSKHIHWKKWYRCDKSISWHTKLKFVGLLVLSLTLFFVWSYDTQKCDPYFIVLYIHAAFWFISLIIHHHIKIRHNLLRVNGYHEFFRQICTLSQMPFYIVSLWSTVLLLMDTAFQQAYSDLRQQCRSENSFFTPVGYLCIVIAIEVLTLVVSISFYLSRVLRFNRKKPPPDVQRDEWIISLIQNTYGSGEVGYRERSSQLQDLLEKQADVIRSLKEQNGRLSQKIMLLSSQLRISHT